jgi:dolichyl-diphosphooligosaccharide--protein glycosyltransferase
MGTPSGTVKKISDTSPSTGSNSFSGKGEYVIHALVLVAICVLAFVVRLFSVIRYESMIHEFDPWFNFRSTKYLVEEGFYNFHNWFDDKAWYPMGRFVGGTVFPGLMWTAAIMFHFLQNVLHFAVNIRNTCVFLSPFMASNTALATYFLTKEMWNGAAGLVAAGFIALAPGYISRSVAGSFDNEAVAIFALIFCFFLWVRAVNTGSMVWGAAAALGYFNMVAAWGGYVFIINIIPIHALALMLSGRYSLRLYVAYSSFYVLGTLLSMHVQFVGFQPVSFSPEHIGSLGVFGILQLYAGITWIRTLLPQKHLTLLFRSAVALAAGLVSLFVIAAALGKVPFFTARLLSLLGATSNIAIIKSVSEHQPSPWTTFFFDLHCVVFLVPVGIFYCFMHLSDANLFGLLYAIFAAYFASIMVRLVLVLTPIACVLAGIAVNVILTTYSHVIVSIFRPAPATRRPRVSGVIAFAVMAFFAVLFFLFTVHCTWVTSTAYSSPSIVLMANDNRGGRIIFDDFRESYTWLRHNTPEDAKIMSWWDYGYQITGMANRTVIVDNNTRNNTHIATVGLALASNEERAYEVMRHYDVDYVLVVFGGKVGYSSDDINKFLWMVRIASGVHPEVVENDFYNSQGQYRIDGAVSKTFRDSLMYRLCYHKFAEGYGRGYDRVRHTEVGDKDIRLQYLEEAFTTEHWMVRIYRVKKPETHPGFLEAIATEKALAQGTY